MKNSKKKKEQSEQNIYIFFGLVIRFWNTTCVYDEKFCVKASSSVHSFCIWVQGGQTLTPNTYS